MRVGPVVAFRMVEEVGCTPGLNLLHAMDVAITGVKWSNVPSKRKEEMKRAIHADYSD
jgi:hypothetical protein